MGVSLRPILFFGTLLSNPKKNRMRTKLLSLFIAISALFSLTSCERWPIVYSEQVNFSLRADCDADGLAKIEGLFKSKGLPVDQNVSISIVVEVSTTIDDRKLMLRERVHEILKKSITEISNREFNNLKTGATETIYSAEIYSTNEKIGTIVADRGQPL